jgi:hypothetical protein
MNKRKADAMHRLEALAKLGYGARGIVYGLVGGLALFTSIGGAREIDSKSALDFALHQPFGRVWLGLIAIGLVCFVLWRIVQAAANADRQPDDGKGYLIRAGLLVSAATYASLALYAAGSALATSSGSGEGGERGLAAWLMSQPFGRILAAIVGCAIIGAGVAQITKAIKGGYRRYIHFPPARRAVLDSICAYGLAARGAIFLITGTFFITAAWRVDPKEAGSLSDAMTFIRDLPFGGILYAVAALGLFAFGGYSLIAARYRRIARVALPEAVAEQARALS